MQKKKDERLHAKELQAMERAEKKAQQELDRQRKKDEQEHKKAEHEIERMKRKDDVEHAKSLKDLETRAKKGSIDQAKRDAIMKELEVEMARYREEFALAQTAMRDALQRRRSCTIDHTAPKIDWGSPPDVEPRVVPGHVSWRASG